MIHIVSKPNGKQFEVVVVRNGEILLGSRTQGYERKEGCYKMIKSLMKEFLGATEAVFQDNTLEKPTQFLLSADPKNKPLATKKRATALKLK